MDDLDAIVQWLVDFVSEIASYLVQLAQYIWNVLVAVGQFLWQVLQDAFHYAWTFLKSVVSLFRSLWDNFFKKIFTAVWGALQKAQAWLEEKLAPIINFFKKLRAIYDRWFKLYIKPILNVISTIRHIIEILKLLHISILNQLDAFLAKVQLRITTAVLTIRGILNNVIDLLNLIADPLNIVRRPTLIYSFRRVFLSTVRVFTGLPPGFFVPSPKSSAKTGTGFLPLNFDPNDPSMNPPASSYAGNDGLPGDFAGFLPGIEPQDTDIDQLIGMDYFDGSLYPDPVCGDVGTCMTAAFLGLSDSDIYG